MNSGPHTVESRIARLCAGASPRVLDLFAGCGGISLGFQRAGFEIVAAIEADLRAAETHALNFGGVPGAGPRDISAIAPEAFAEELRSTGVDADVDVIVGGPPCQAFARVGRAKLRQVLSNPSAHLDDPRSNLYLRYIDFVRHFRPLAVLLENVPEFLNYGGHNIAEEICEVLEAFGYVCRYTLLNAVHYGVPQLRERVFLLAFREELGARVSFPEPTHWFILPPGYQGTRTHAVQHTTPDLFRPLPRLVPSPDPSRDLPPAITVREAIADLPRLTDHLGGVELPSFPVEEAPATHRGDFAQVMREWPGFDAPDQPDLHVTRRLPRDYAIFASMAPGDRYPEARRIAEELFEAERKRLEKECVALEPGTPVYDSLWRRVVPPYNAKKFSNKWRKINPDEPSRTLMAHLGRDSYTHIHYDGTQARTITIREAARLQSFPDGFRFAGGMNAAFQQIGNAVPPLLAWRLARIMNEAMKVARPQPPSQSISLGIERLGNR